MIIASNLEKSFGPQVLFNSVSFLINPGERIGLVGKNGAGKSTTMRMLTGNLAPSDGSVKICGFDMVANPKKAKEMIGYLPEMRPLYKELTVDEFLTIAARFHKVQSSKIRRSVDSAKEKCGLTHMSKRLIENLSNGYQQRVGIAQAIIHDPEIVILDEPTVGLDPIQIREIRKLIKDIGKKHSVILSTHILPEVEMVCDRVQIINQGDLVFNGSIEDLKKQRRGNKLLVGFNNAPLKKELLAIEGVSQVDKIDNTMYRVHFNHKYVPAEEIVITATKKKWGLFHICLLYTSPSPRD